MTHDSGRITVFVDDEPVRIWEWAKIRHALLRHSEQRYYGVRRGDETLTDAAGHRVDLEGALCDGARFYLRSRARPAE